MRAELPFLAAGAAILLLSSGLATSASKENPVVILKTSLGEIKVELYTEKAPKTVENFLAYVDAEFFDGTLFHRVIPNFMIQGGGLNADLGKKQTRAPIVNEADNGLKNEVGTLAMARTSAKDSATAQFFINLASNGSLNHGARDFGYAVFGRVIDGMEVVDKIAASPTGPRGGLKNVPKTDVVIESARRQ